MNAPFDYPEDRHVRKHGPSGYENYASYKPWLRDEFGFRCVYCLFRERWKSPIGHAAFAVEHFHPKSRNPALSDAYDNLFYACNVCNFFKGDLFVPPSPSAEPYGRLLRVMIDGRIVPISPGSSRARIIIEVFRLNSPEFIAARAATGFSCIAD